MDSNHTGMHTCNNCNIDTSDYIIIHAYIYIYINLKGIGIESEKSIQTS